jgi:hypothetical protein
MLSRFRRNESGFFIMGEMGAIVALVLYIVVWLLLRPSLGAHIHHPFPDTFLRGLFQGFFILAGILEHFIFHPHVIAVWQGPTITIQYGVGYIIGVLVFLGVCFG